MISEQTAKKVHALLGGGPGLNGRYVAGETWCGVERRPKRLFFAETTSKVTCKTCIRLKAAHKMDKKK